VKLSANSLSVLIARTVLTSRRDQTVICDVNIGYSVRDKYGSGAPPSPRPRKRPVAVRRKKPAEVWLNSYPQGWSYTLQYLWTWTYRETVLNELLKWYFMIKRENCVQIQESGINIISPISKILTFIISPYTLTPQTIYVQFP